MEASFLVSLEIAKKKKPHTIGEQPIVPCAKTMFKLVLGEKSVETLFVISLSKDTLRRRMCELSLDITKKIIDLFSIQLDESIDVQSCS